VDAHEARKCTAVRDQGRRRIVLVEVALEAADPLGVGAGDGEAGEELRDGPRRRGPIHLPQRVHQVLRRYRAPVHLRRSPGGN
jgi:hypothetical protein